VLPALILDLETVRRFPLSEGEDPAAFPPPPVWRIITAGMCWLGRDAAGAPVARILSEWGDERTLLLGIVAAMARKQQPLLVTWAGRRFDLPVIEAAMMVTRTTWATLRADRDMLIRWSCAAHVDLCDKLALDGAAPTAKLAQWGKATGLGAKLEDANDVASMYAAGEYERIARYCAGDVRLTAALYARWLLTRGDIGDEEELEWQRVIAEAVPVCREATMASEKPATEAA